MSWAGVDLTTIAAVISYGGPLKVQSGDANYAVLQSMISSVSQKMEQYCSRRFQIATYTESRADLRSPLFPVKNPTVQSVSAVSVSYTGRLANLSSIPDFEISPDGNGINVWACLRPGVLVQVTYSGGLYTTTSDVLNNDPALADACNMQVVSLWQRHTMPDRTGTTLNSGETHWNAEYSLLKEVKATLDNRYSRRHAFQ